jgi:hypothetical protein
MGSGHVVAVVAVDDQKRLEVNIDFLLLIVLYNDSVAQLTTAYHLKYFQSLAY